MIYKFPTNKTFDDVINDTQSITLDSFSKSNLPSGKLGKIVEIAIEIYDKCGVRVYVNTKVPIGKRSKLVEICFLKDSNLFVCALSSDSNLSGQLLDFAENCSFIATQLPEDISLIPVLVSNSSNKQKLIVGSEKIFQGLQLNTIQQADLCDTLNAWRS
jgi:hypothetical protein